jgi:hypothetical protein
VRVDPRTDRVNGAVTTGVHPQRIVAAGGSLWVVEADAGRVAEVRPG